MTASHVPETNAQKVALEWVRLHRKSEAENHDAAAPKVKSRVRAHLRYRVLSRWAARKSEQVGTQETTEEELPLEGRVGWFLIRYELTKPDKGNLPATFILLADTDLLAGPTGSGLPRVLNGDMDHELSLQEFWEGGRKEDAPFVRWAPYELPSIGITHETVTAHVPPAVEAGVSYGYFCGAYVAAPINKSHVYHAGDTQPLPDTTNGIVCEVFGKALSGSKYSVANITMQPGHHSVLNKKPKGQETLCITKGAGRVTLNGKSFPVQAGDTVNAMPDTWMQVFNETNEDLSYVAIMAPPFDPTDVVYPPANN